MLVESNFITLLGRHSTVTGVKDKNAKWNDIANRLNQIGPTKTVKQWNRVKNRFLFILNFFSMHIYIMAAR